MKAEATKIREHPILFSSPMVRALLAGRKTQTRRIVSPNNSTVLGHPAKSYWPNLHFSHAQVRKTSLIAAISGIDDDVHLAVPWRHPDDSENETLEECGKYQTRPKWERGDRLWVKETWRPKSNAGPYNEDDGSITITYAADGETRYIDDELMPADWALPKAAKTGNVSPLFMTRWASRLTLEIADVRVQQVQDVSEADAIAEGIQIVSKDHRFHPDAYTINGGTEPWWPTAVDAFRSLWNSINGEDAWGRNDWVWALTLNKLPNQ